VVVVADRAGGDYAGKPRPAVVVQSDMYDQTLSLVVCPLTSREPVAPISRAVASAAGMSRSSPVIVAVAQVVPAAQHAAPSTLAGAWAA